MRCFYVKKSIIIRIAYTFTEPNGVTSRTSGYKCDDFGSPVY